MFQVSMEGFPTPLSQVQYSRRQRHAGKSMAYKPLADDENVPTGEGREQGQNKGQKQDKGHGEGRERGGGGGLTPMSSRVQGLKVMNEWLQCLHNNNLSLGSDPGRWESG
jgi:hypothetical protein